MISDLNEWLIKNADAPIKYRVKRELLGEKQIAEFEEELLQNTLVQKWLELLTPQSPPQHWNMLHGCFDFNLENALPTCVHLGLHGEISALRQAVEFYIKNLKQTLADSCRPLRNAKTGFGNILTANFLAMAEIKDDFVIEYLLGSLDEMYNFIKKYGYDIYIGREERSKLTGAPKNWKDTEFFIKAEILSEYGFPFPLIYDIFGFHVLYSMKNAEINAKIDAVISYFLCDEYHEKISDGYGILIAGEYASKKPKYNGMGWSPHISGWFNLENYFLNGNVAKLLFYAEYLAKFFIMQKTKWYSDLLAYLEKFKTENGTYIFPKQWLPEKSGYAVQGFHMSFGENRRKRNWCEIESTFYMQILKQKATF